MSFLFPAFLIGALTIAIPIVLHLMKREVAPELPFSDIRFLQRAPVTQARRRRLREFLLLALRVSALLLLTFAFARPFFDAGGLLTRPVTMVALDRSFSMAAPGQFERAREMAQAAIDDAPVGTLVGLVTFDDHAQVVHEPTAERDRTAVAVDQVLPGAGGTRYAAGLTAAVEQIGSREGRVVVVSDLQQSGWDESVTTVPANVTVEVREVGAVADNLAIAAVERGPTGVVGVVLNTGTLSGVTTITLRLDGAAIETIEHTAGPGSSDVTFSFDLPQVGVLDLSLEDPDGAPSDDRRYLLLDPPDPAPLVLVTDDGRTVQAAFYLERALLAGEESPYDIRSVSPRSLSSPASDPLAETAAVLLLGTQGLERAGRELLASFVDAGGGLLIVTGPRLDTELVADALGAATRLAFQPGAASGEMGMSVTDARHPIFRPFGSLLGTLGQVRFRQTARLAEDDTSSGRMLARFDDGSAAIVEYAVGSGRALVFASDLNNEWNDFPRRPSFVPFVHEVVRYLVGARERQRDFTIADAPAGVPKEPGVVTLPGSGRRATLNVDPRESNPMAVTADSFLARVTQGMPAEAAVAERTETAAREAEQGYWWYALLAMGVLLVSEAWLARTMAQM